MAYNFSVEELKTQALEQISAQEAFNFYEYLTDFQMHEYFDDNGEITDEGENVIAGLFRYLNRYELLIYYPFYYQRRIGNHMYNADLIPTVINQCPMILEYFFLRDPRLVNYQFTNGQTPLHLMVERVSTPAWQELNNYDYSIYFDLLIAYGCNPLITNENNETGIDYMTRALNRNIYDEVLNTYSDFIKYRIGTRGGYEPLWKRYALEDDRLEFGYIEEKLEELKLEAADDDNGNGNGDNEFAPPGGPGFPLREQRELQIPGGPDIPLVDADDADDAGDADDADEGPDQLAMLRDVFGFGFP